MTEKDCQTLIEQYDELLTRFCTAFEEKRYAEQRKRQLLYRTVSFLGGVIAGVLLSLFV